MTRHAPESSDHAPLDSADAIAAAAAAQSGTPTDAPTPSASELAVLLGNADAAWRAVEAVAGALHAQARAARLALGLFTVAAARAAASASEAAVTSAVASLDAMPAAERAVVTRAAAAAYDGPRVVTQRRAPPVPDTFDDPDDVPGEPEPTRETIAR